MPASSLPFSEIEYARRLNLVRKAMEKDGIDVLFVEDPSNMAWLTGYDGWSFYVHQGVLVFHDADPIWWGREQDANGAVRTVYMDDTRVLSYPDHYVQSTKIHPMETLAAIIREHGYGEKRVGLELENYYFSAKAYLVLQRELPDATLVDATALVNWQRAVKSDEEIVFMRRAARISEKIVDGIMERVEPGLKKNDLVAEIYADAVRGVAPHPKLRVAEPEHAGFLGPVGWDGPMVVDPAAAAVTDGICGANEGEHHLRHVRHGRDFAGEVADIRMVATGDPCPRCGAGLELYRGIEAGHIFMLGTHYSQTMKAEFLDAEGNSRPIIMGCYGIGVSRLVAAVVEQLHDDDGLVWPLEVAPYSVIVTPLGGDEPAAVAEELYEALRARGLQVLLDDRNERPGVKLKDADLLGIPLRLTVGKRGLQEGKIELKRRRSGETTFVPRPRCVDEVVRIVAEGP